MDLPMSLEQPSIGPQFLGSASSISMYSSSHSVPHYATGPYNITSPIHTNLPSPIQCYPSYPVHLNPLQPKYQFQDPKSAINHVLSSSPSMLNELLDEAPNSMFLPNQQTHKRPNPFSSMHYPSKHCNMEYPFGTIQSSIEDLASQQFQRNEMDGIIQERITSSVNYSKNYASLMVMDNSMWTADDMTMVLFAMYRVLLQSRPDAPNELMLQIPITCSNLLPLLITQFAPCQLQNGNAVKLVMKQLAFQIQQQHLPLEPPFIDNEILYSVKHHREYHYNESCSSEHNLFRSDLVYVLLKEMDTTDNRKEFYLEEYLRCLFLNNINRADFVQSFIIFFYNQVEECLAYERKCNAGEMSQLVISTRNLQSSDSSSSGDIRINGLGFSYHHHLDFLLTFCSRYFIRPFPTPLFLAVLNLFRSSIVLSAFNSISKCVYSIVLTQPELAVKAVRFLIRSWPTRDSSREVLFIRQLECFFQIVSMEQQQVLFSMMFGTVKKTLQSDNRFVSLQSLQMLMRIVQTNISIIDMKMIPILSDVLSSLQNHWCDTIRQCASSCLRSMLLKAELRSSGEEEALQNREEAFTS